MMAVREEDVTEYRYLEGFLELRQGKEYQKLFCVLNAQTLSFYDQKKTARELERSQPLERAQLIWKKTTFKPDELKLGIKHILGNSNELKLKFTSTEERDNWYIRLYTISYGTCPSDIQLLPGQIQISNDLLQRENLRKHRRASASDIQEPSHPPPEPPAPRPTSRRFSDLSLTPVVEKDHYNLYPPGHPASAQFPPSWYFGKIPRRHAEQILESNPKYGDLLVRASESTNGPGEFSLSVRQIGRDGKAIVRHYKLNRMNLQSGLNGYKLDIDEAHTHRNSVYELLLFFIEKSGGTLRLFETQDSTKLKMPDNLYENRFSDILFTSDPCTGEPVPVSPGTRHNSSFVRKPAPWQQQQPPIQEDNYLAPDVNPGAAAKPADGGYMEPSHKYENTTRGLIGVGRGTPKAPNGLPKIKEESKSKSSLIKKFSK